MPCPRCSAPGCTWPGWSSGAATCRTSACHAAHTYATCSESFPYGNPADAEPGLPLPLRGSAVFSGAWTTA